MHNHLLGAQCYRRILLPHGTSAKSLRHVKQPLRFAAHIKIHGPDNVATYLSRYKNQQHTALPGSKLGQVRKLTRRTSHSLCRAASLNGDQFNHTNPLFPKVYFFQIWWFGLWQNNTKPVQSLINVISNLYFTLVQLNAFTYNINTWEKIRFRDNCKFVCKQLCQHELKNVFKIKISFWFSNWQRCIYFWWLQWLFYFWWLVAFCRTDCRRGWSSLSALQSLLTHWLYWLLILLIL